MDDAAFLYPILVPGEAGVAEGAGEQGWPVRLCSLLGQDEGVGYRLAIMVRYRGYLPNLFIDVQRSHARSRDLYQRCYSATNCGDWGAGHGVGLC